jgi:pimeloyl-ACP methyl ester carboxylesterase
MEHVTSADGTRVSYERSGSGPPLVLVHGSLNDRNAWGLVVPAFRERFTVYAMDRRGRGESGPPAEHELAREFEDVVAVIEAAGAPVDLLGHSYGAHCALGAAALAPEQVKHLVLYEPPMVVDDGLELALKFERLDPSEALAWFLRDGVGMPPDQVDTLRASPFWDYMRSFVPTMPPEGRALVGTPFDASRYATLKIPALFLVGSETKEHLGEVLRQLAPYMPQARWHEFEGQGHGANLLAPQEFADVVLEFLASGTA